MPSLSFHWYSSPFSLQPVLWPPKKECSPKHNSFIRNERAGAMCVCARALNYAAQLMLKSNMCSAYDFLSIFDFQSLFIYAYSPHPHTPQSPFLPLLRHLGIFFFPLHKNVKSFPLKCHQMSFRNLICDDIVILCQSWMILYLIFLWMYRQTQAERNKMEKS